MHVKNALNCETAEIRNHQLSLTVQCQSVSKHLIDYQKKKNLSAVEAYNSPLIP
jgi:hypothetical protein